MESAIRHSSWWRGGLAAVVALLALALMLLVGHGHVQAAASGSSAFDINGGNPVNVGQTGVPYTYRVVNSSTSPQDAENVTLTSMTGYPSCNTIDFGPPLCATVASQNAGVFNPAATATGVAGTACAGSTFTVVMNAAGLWTFTPAVPATFPVLGPSNVGGPSATCSIAGTLTVSKLPADGDSILAGVQTRQLSDATGTTNTTSEQFVGLGSAEVTVTAPDLSITKVAGSGTVTVGGVASYTITATNTGTGVATAATVSDTLQGTGWAITPAVTGCAIAAGPPQVLTCTVASLAVGGTISVTVQKTTAAPTDCGTINNTATVAATNVTPADADDSASAAITVVCTPDLSITKVAGSGTVTVGGVASYTITATNTGTAVATNATVSDTLQGTGWAINPAVTGCAIAAGPPQVLTCTVASLAVGGTISVAVQKTTVPADCPTINNTATVTATNVTPADADDSASAAITVVCTPDLSITKVAGSGTVTVGGVASYTITATNTGTAVATNATVSDTLQGTGWTITPAVTGCAIAAGPPQVLTCTVASLAVGGTISVAVQKTTAPADCPTINNTATVTATNVTPADADDSASAAITVVCTPDLSITKVAGSGTVTVGGVASYTITATNTGNAPATNATVSDTLQGTGWTINPAVTGCAIAAGPPQVLTCTVASLAAGGTISVTVQKTTAAPADCGTINNTATVTATNVSPADADDSASAAITVVCTPDLSITKVAGSGTVTVGGVASYTITAMNTGNAPATNATVSDTLQGTGWTINPAVTGCAIAAGPPQVLTCTVASLAVGGTISVTVQKTTAAPADCGTINNTATVTATNVTPADADDSASAAITVVCTPDLKITKVAGSSTVTVGGLASYTITATNTGTAVATNATVSDTLQGTGWTITPAVTGCAIAAGPPQVLTCTVASLAAGGTISVTVQKTTAAPADCGTINNTATVTATNVSPADADDSASAAITVVCTPDLSITKVAGSGTVTVGGVASYTITATNTGNAPATNATVSDTLQGTGWTITPAVTGCAIAAGPPQVLTCTVASLAAGGTISVTVQKTTAAPADCGTINNTATVTATNVSPADADDSASAAITVVCTPDLSITKVAGSGTVTVGGVASYTITATNTGNAPATAATVSDTLQGTGWTITPAVTGCAIAAGPPQVLTCTVASLAAGGTISVTVQKTTAAPADCGTINNTATVAATNVSPADADDSASAAITVVCTPDLSITKVAGSGTVTVGGVASYTITATNTGNAPATNATVSDTLQGTGWTITPAVTGCAIAAGPPQVLTCTVASLAAGGTISVTVQKTTAAPADCGTINNTATVTATNVTPADADDSASAAITVVCTPDLKITKVAGSSTVMVGGMASYTITATNTGNAPATNATVSDTLQGTGWTINPAVTGCAIAAGPPQVLTCTVASLAAGGTISVTVQKTTVAADCPTINNTATVAATNVTPADADDSASAAITVTCTPATSLAVSGNGSPTVTSGTPVTLTVIETNSGNVPLTNVNVTGTGCTPWTPATVASLAPLGTATFTCTFTPTVTTPWTAQGNASFNGSVIPVTASEKVSGTVTVLQLQACSPGFFKNHPGIESGGTMPLSVLGFTGTDSTVSIQDGLSLTGGGLHPEIRDAAAAFFNEEASGIPQATAIADIKALVLAGNAAALSTRVDDSMCSIPSGPATPHANG